MPQPRCWGFRISTQHIAYLATALEQGRLRQGWGYDAGQDLRNLTFDAGARRNLRMLGVKRDDLLLVPRLPVWGQVAIVKATADWDSGYRFEIGDCGDFGHIFPARLVKSFVRSNDHVAGQIRATLRNPSRFWNIDRLYPSIAELLDASGDLGSAKDPLEKARDVSAGVFHEVLSKGEFERLIFETLNDKLEGKDWERVLEDVIRMRYPAGDVRIVQGRSESHHGTDILVTLPDITGYPTYAIAIQVKDHQGHVNPAAVRQIGKADYWNAHDLKLIQKVVVFIRADRRDNPGLVELAKEEDVQVVFEKDLSRILKEWALDHAAKSLQ